MPSALPVQKRKSNWVLILYHVPYSAFWTPYNRSWIPRAPFPNWRLVWAKNIVSLGTAKPYCQVLCHIFPIVFFIPSVLILIPSYGNVSFHVAYNYGTPSPASYFPHYCGCRHQSAQCEVCICSRTRRNSLERPVFVGHIRQDNQGTGGGLPVVVCTSACPLHARFCS